jgi:hypothetical protein
MMETKFSKGDWTKEDWCTVYDKDEERIAKISDRGFIETCANSALIAAAPQLFTAHLLRDAIDCLRIHTAEGGQYDVVYESAKTLCEERGFVLDTTQHPLWNHTQLKDFVKNYTDRAIAKALNIQEPTT